MSDKRSRTPPHAQPMRTCKSGSDAGELAPLGMPKRSDPSGFVAASRVSPTASTDTLNVVVRPSSLLPSDAAFSPRLNRSLSSAALLSAVMARSDSQPWRVSLRELARTLADTGSTDSVSAGDELRELCRRCERGVASWPAAASSVMREFRGRHRCPLSPKSPSTTGFSMPRAGLLSGDAFGDVVSSDRSDCGVLARRPMRGWRAGNALFSPAGEGDRRRTWMGVWVLPANKPTSTGVGRRRRVGDGDGDLDSDDRLPWMRSLVRERPRPTMGEACMSAGPTTDELARRMS